MTPMRSFLAFPFQLVGWLGVALAFVFAVLAAGVLVFADLIGGTE